MIKEILAGALGLGILAGGLVSASYIRTHRCSLNLLPQCSISGPADGEQCRDDLTHYKNVWFQEKFDLSTPARLLDVIPQPENVSRPFACVSRSGSMTVTGTNYRSPVHYRVVTQGDNRTLSDIYGIPFSEGRQVCELSVPPEPDVLRYLFHHGIYSADLAESRMIIVDYLCDQTADTILFPGKASITNVQEAVPELGKLLSEKLREYHRRLHIDDLLQPP
ncbi:hypothetical protein HYU22_01950 [Candidatus Woesearchaeota archaeon]|nr:hypothetical protein [Candidatus Woesearchaeota archaeon]